MKQSGGLAATIALLLAAILEVSYFPRKSGDTIGATELATFASRPTTGAKNAATPEQKPLTSCQQIAKRLRRVYAPDETVPLLPVSCFPSGVSEALDGARRAPVQPGAQAIK
jgi:hypothetical protein